MNLDKIDPAEIDYSALLGAINNAGYGYSSEWIGKPGARSGAMFKAYKGRRKVGEWVGTDPADVAFKAAIELGVQL